MAFIPTPDEFPTWQEWARHVVEVLSNSVGTESGAPELANPNPPIKKILRAAVGSYALAGKNSEFRLGALQYAMPGTRVQYLITGQDAQMTLEALSPLDADAGAYTITGADAALSIDQGLPTEGSAVTTFHSIGLYWQPPSAPLNDAVKIRYKRSTDSAWRMGHDLWYDARAAHGRPVEARGSIVHCIPGTTYDVQFGMPQSDGSIQWVAKLSTTTWSESFPEGDKLVPWSGTKTSMTTSNFAPPQQSQTRQHVLLMDRSGTASGYTVYDFTGQNAVAQAPLANNAFCVVVKGHHMILRGLKCVGGEASIWIEPGTTDVIIEDCELTEMGRADSNGVSYGFPLNGPRGQDGDAAIRFPHSAIYGNNVYNTKRIIIQRNKIHNPAVGANTWDDDHPYGIAPIYFGDTGGNIVIRYNEIYSTEDGTLEGAPKLNKFWYDGIVGQLNFAAVGAAPPDLDIYMNQFRHCADDGMEAEGGGMNVRIWKNYVDYVASPIATTSISIGPTYIWRNVINRVRSRYRLGEWGSEGPRFAAFKNGDRSDIGWGGGMKYFYHNLTMQHPSDGQPDPLGAGGGIHGTGTSEPVRYTVTRNNYFNIRRLHHDPIGFPGSPNDFDWDISNANGMGVNESNGRVGAPSNFKPGHGPLAYATGKYQLAPGSPGHDDGVRINNFNDDVDAPHQFLGAAPDRGAHEEGSADMMFGTTATGS